MGMRRDGVILPDIAELHAMCGDHNGMSNEYEGKILAYYVKSFVEKNINSENLVALGYDKIKRILDEEFHSNNGDGDSQALLRKYFYGRTDFLARSISCLIDAHYSRSELNTNFYWLLGSINNNFEMSGKILQSFCKHLNQTPPIGYEPKPNQNILLGSLVDFIKNSELSKGKDWSDDGISGQINLFKQMTLLLSNPGVFGRIPPLQFIGKAIRERALQDSLNRSVIADAQYDYYKQVLEDNSSTLMQKMKALHHIFNSKKLSKESPDKRKELYNTISPMFMLIGSMFYMIPAKYCYEYYRTFYAHKSIYNTNVFDLFKVMSLGWCGWIPHWSIIGDIYKISCLCRKYKKESSTSPSALINIFGNLAAVSYGFLAFRAISYLIVPPVLLTFGVINKLGVPGLKKLSQLVNNQSNRSAAEMEQNAQQRAKSLAIVQRPEEQQSNEADPVSLISSSYEQ